MFNVLAIHHMAVSTFLIDTSAVMLDMLTVFRFAMIAGLYLASAVMLDMSDTIFRPAVVASFIHASFAGVLYMLAIGNPAMVAFLVDAAAVVLHVLAVIRQAMATSLQNTSAVMLDMLAVDFLAVPAWDKDAAAIMFIVDYTIFRPAMIAGFKYTFCAFMRRMGCTIGFSAGFTRYVITCIGIRTSGYEDGNIPQSLSPDTASDRAIIKRSPVAPVPMVSSIRVQPLIYFISRSVEPDISIWRTLVCESDLSIRL